MSKSTAAAMSVYRWSTRSRRNKWITALALLFLIGGCASLEEELEPVQVTSEPATTTTIDAPDTTTDDEAPALTSPLGTPPEAPSAAMLTMTPATVELSALGETVRLAAEVRDQSGNSMAGAKFFWESSDDTVATVNATGLVTAVGNGTVTITATAGSASSMATVVVAQTIAVVAVEPMGLISTQAGTQGADTIVATALDGGGSPVANASYRWSTDRHSGWVYPPAGTTNPLGRSHAIWVAGWPGEGTLSVTVENEFSRVTQELTTLSTTHQPSSSTCRHVDLQPESQCGLLDRHDSTH